MGFARDHKPALFSLAWVVAAIVTVLGSWGAGTLWSQHELYRSPGGDVLEKLINLAAAAGAILALFGVVTAGRAIAKGDRVAWAVLPLSILVLFYAAFGFLIFNLFTL